jgi:hypothetical protein
MKTLENKVIVNNDNEKPFNKMKISELKVIIKKEKKTDSRQYSKPTFKIATKVLQKNK